MEEERKRIVTTEGLANGDSPFNKQIEEIREAMLIPKEKLPKEAPGTAEQLKQFYNSEQWKEFKEAVIRAGETLIEAAKPVIKAVAEVVKNMHNTIIEAYKTDPEVKKCYGIYKRTKKRKDKKKANDQDKQNNREKVY